MYECRIHQKEVNTMNKNLTEAIFEIEKVEAILATVEKLYLDFDVLPEEKKRLDQGVYVFYALWDAVKKVADDLDKLSGDCKVVDAIYAVNDVRERAGTLTTKN